jgi:hypothetical protein
LLYASDYANLYSAPDSTRQIKRLVRRGELLNVLPSTGEFAAVAGPSGDTVGFVRREILAGRPPEPEPVKAWNPRELIGQCAYNPSDRKYLGKVIDVGPEGSDAYGRSAPGQRAVKIAHAESQIEVKFPKYLVVEPCSRR